MLYQKNEINKKFESEQKEGGIMKILFKSIEYFIGGQLVMRECYKQMEIVSKKKKCQPIELPTLPNLNMREIQKSQQQLCESRLTQSSVSLNTEKELISTNNHFKCNIKIYRVDIQRNN